MQEYDNKNTSATSSDSREYRQSSKQAQCNSISQTTVKGSWYEWRIGPAGTDDDAVAQKRFCHLLRHSRG
jgi:hypothetical protein